MPKPPEFELAAIIDSTKAMMEIPSLSDDPEKCKMVLEMAANFLGPDFNLQRFFHNNAWSFLFSVGDDSMHPELLLNGHIDVVKAKADEFIPKVEDSRLIGRGAGDMKGHVAAMMAAFKEFVQKNGAGKNLGLLLTSDEEIGGRDGTRHVIEQGLRPARVFIPDAIANFNIIEAQKAPYHFHIKASGKGGHASRAFELDNPFNRIFAVYDAMRAKYAIATSENSWASTFEMTVLTANQTSPNSIPDEAEAWFSWRFPIEQHTFEDGTADFNALCQAFRCERLDEHGDARGFLLASRELDFIKSWQRIVKELKGENVEFGREHGASDARHFHAHDIPVLITSALVGNFHTEGEWADTESLLLLTQAIYRLLEEV